MAHDVISTCPVCSNELTVIRLQCRSCGTAIEGEFNVGRFGRLGREQLGLLEGFLRARGNLKELERELKLSYPTVRARVDALVRSLGLADGGAAEGGLDAAVEEPDPNEEQAAESARAAADAETRRQVLERLARHDIGADEAAAIIRALGRS